MMKRAIFCVFLICACSRTQSSLSPQNSSRLAVNTDPANATIFLDGTFFATSPTGLMEVNPGSHDIRAEMEGYATKDTSVTVEEGIDLTIELGLKQRVDLVWESGRFDLAVANVEGERRKEVIFDNPEFPGGGYVDGRFLFSSGDQPENVEGANVWTTLGGVLFVAHIPDDQLNILEGQEIWVRLFIPEYLYRVPAKQTFVLTIENGDQSIEGTESLHWSGLRIAESPDAFSGGAPERISSILNFYEADLEEIQKFILM